MEQPEVEYATEQLGDEYETEELVADPNHAEMDMIGNGFGGAGEYDARFRTGKIDDDPGTIGEVVSGAIPVG